MSATKAQRHKAAQSVSEPLWLGDLVASLCPLNQKSVTGPGVGGRLLQEAIRDQARRLQSRALSKSVEQCARPAQFDSVLLTRIFASRRSPPREPPARSAVACRQETAQASFAPFVAVRSQK